MKRRAILGLAAVIVAGMGMAPFAAAESGPAAPGKAEVPLSFQGPLVLRGTLGDEQIQMSIRPKPVAAEGLEGEYFIFGRSQRILLAGEAEGADLFLEESENGTDVSGHWNATVAGDTISGDWASVGGSVTKRFSLKAMPVDTKAARARPASAGPARAAKP